MVLLLLKKTDVKKILESQQVFVVAVYGMGLVGSVFLKALRDWDVCVCYGIDQKGEAGNAGLEIKRPAEISQDMDMIVVTSEAYYEEIYSQLKEKVSVPIVLLSQLLDELLRIPISLENLR